MYKISIAMCTYNGALFIESQISSILHQTKLPDEIIVCDDGSTDETIEIILKLLTESGIKHDIVVNSQNLGITKNFEKAISLCKGDIIFLADQDDVWNREKIEKIYLCFSEQAETDLVFSNARLVDQNSKEIKYNMWQLLKFNPSILTNGLVIKKLLSRNYVTGATLAIRRNTFNYIFPFSKSWNHDYWIAANVAIFGKIFSVEEELIDYRQHQFNQIGSPSFTLTSKINNYKNNYWNIQSIFKHRLQMWEDFEYHVKFKDINQSRNLQLIRKCLKFWQRRNASNKPARVFSLVRDAVMCNYSKYYNGVKGAIAEFIFLILRY